MRELIEISNWASKVAPHELKFVDSLPAPHFYANGEYQVSFSSNNYLALASSKRLIGAARRGLERFGVGNCESRLLGGNLEIYDALEAKIAAMKDKDASVLFATGYLTNLGVLSSLPRAGQYARIYGYRAKSAARYAYFSDQFNHLSIREGIRASGAESYTFKHANLDHLETLLKKSDEDHKIIVTDGVFSQDGDIADLPGLIALAERYDAMVYVDDAHGTGVLGANGRGISEHFGVVSERLIHMGTLSKAYGAIGGFVATDKAIADILRLSCAAYGFTSTLPPDQAFAVSEAIDAVQDEPQRRQQLWDNQRYFVERMRELPYSLVSTQTPIVPIMVGDETEADRFAARLEAERIHVDAVKFPAVPLRKARLRIQLNAAHTREQIDALVGVLAGGQNRREGNVVPILRPRATAADRIRALPAAAFSSLKAGLCIARKAGAAAAARLGLADIGLPVTLNLVAIATAMLIMVDLRFEIPHLIFAYLLPILFVARRFGQFSAVIASAVSAACAALFLYDPILSFNIYDLQDLKELAVFSTLAFAMSLTMASDASAPRWFQPRS